MNSNCWFLSMQHVDFLLTFLNKGWRQVEKKVLIIRKLLGILLVRQTIMISFCCINIKEKL